MNYSNKILNTISLSRCYIGCFIIVIHYSAMHGARWNDSSVDDSLWQSQESLVFNFRIRSRDPDQIFSSGFVGVEELSE